MHELDQKLLRQSCARVAEGYAEADFLCREIGTRLLQRLELVTLEPTRILDLGSGPGELAPALAAHYNDAQIINLDRSQDMLRVANSQVPQVCADAHQLPFVDASFDLAISNMMLPGCVLPERVFSEARRTLGHPGLFLFSTLGPDTLKELFRAWSRVDNTPHIHAFADMHNVGDALVQAGFREPVMDVECLTVTYADISGLVRDLRGIGATNVLLGRRRGLTTPRLWQAMLAELENARNDAGRLEFTVEVVTGQAWTGPQDTGVTMVDGEAAFPLSRLKS